MIDDRGEELVFEYRIPEKEIELFLMESFGIENKEYTLSWPDFLQIPADWKIVLIDRYSNRSVNLLEQSEYHYEHTDNEDGEPRFQLQIIRNESLQVEVPQKVSLRQNYPNPFNPTTTIAFDLPQQSAVKIEIFDTVGRKVQTLLEQSFSAGSHSVTFDASGLSSGVYFYRLTTDQTVLDKRFTVIK